MTATVVSLNRGRLIGDQFHDDLIRLRHIPGRSRLFILMVWCSHEHGYFSWKVHHLSSVLDATVRQVRRWRGEIVSTGWFTRDEQDPDKFWRAYPAGEVTIEVRAEFERCARRSRILDSRAAVAWALSFLMHRTGVTRASERSLSTATGRCLRSVKTALRFLADMRYVRRFGGNHRGSVTHFTSYKISKARLDSMISTHQIHRESRENIAAGRVVNLELGCKIRTRKGARSVPVRVQDPVRSLYIESTKKGNNQEGGTKTVSLGETVAPRSAASGVRTSGAPSFPRVVDLFPSKRARPVISCLVRSSGAVGFTRRTDVVALVAELLAIVLREHFHRIPPRTQVAAWEKIILRLCRELDDPRPAERVYRAVRWYVDHHDDDKYVPQVASGRALYNKFVDLERAMKERSPELVSRRTAEDVLVERLGSRRKARSFEESAVRLARELRLTSDDAALASGLAELRAHVELARRQSGRFDEQGADDHGGPTSVVCRYVEWLQGQDWDATLRVLRPDSPAFAQWRREEARLDPADRDPVTGESRWER